VEGGPSDRAIVYGVSAWLLGNQGDEYYPVACDLACSAQFDIWVEDVSKRRPANASWRFADYDVRVSYIYQDGQRQRVTIHFSDVPGGWSVGEPLFVWPIGVVVDDSGLRSYGIE
ncbi:MAG TPA: hypothetical protein VD886_16065, partial [Herpetosiphonaceae bacterium]|nr:hypothetical protein [Herpetosiphonaceae bacterium]